MLILLSLEGKVIVFDKIIDRMEVKAGITKDKLEVQQIKEGDYNPLDYQGHGAVGCGM